MGAALGDFKFSVFWSSTVLCCLFSIISSSFFLYDKSGIMFIFMPHGYGSLKSFPELSTEPRTPRRSRHPAAGLALPLSAEPCRTGYRWLRNETKRGSFHWTWNWCKDQSRREKNTTWKNTVQGIKQIFFPPTLWFRCRVKPQVIEVNIQPDRSQNFTSSVLISGLCQNSYIPYIFFSLIPHYFHRKGTLLFNSIQSFLGIRWTFGVLSPAFIRLVISKSYMSI